ncbi:hypothetical protein INS49_006538 [Diaporthe citri]|uniref:uncharacterized protein n=1 Tax=Diaporthe citri TaxID=83186 RepID=UPI001C821FFE|nr:uncharacterized protein INS49_006538 [Diaporthe citri]KAG6364934.1 hypothetical protein INS49_006538 [Diaporthe citri]
MKCGDNEEDQGEGWFKKRRMVKDLGHEHYPKLHHSSLSRNQDLTNPTTSSKMSTTVNRSIRKIADEPTGRLG